MKRLIVVLAFAAALLCGCQKMNDLESRMKTAETDIAALKSDVARLVAAVENNYTISTIAETADGYTITLSNGSTIALKNGKDGTNGKDGNDGKDGKDGKDGDAFFKSVVSEDGVVVITLVDGSVYRLALAEDYPLKNVKSLTYIPDYSDGLATVEYFKPVDARIGMKFMVSPASASTALMKAANAGTLKITPLASYPATRALADEVTELSCSFYSFEQDGLITVTVDASGLSADFFTGKSAAAVAMLITDGVSGISSAFVPLTKVCTGLEYGGETYRTAKMADGKVWMAENLRYLPEGYVPCSNVNNVTGGVYMPVVMNGEKTAVIFGSAADVLTQGYLYQSEVALGLSVGDIKDEEQAKALEGARGICPEGWHIPTIDDITGLVGKAVSPIVTNTSAPYYDGKNGSVKMLNDDGFNLFACGAVSIQDNTKTSGTLMGKLGKYDYISSGYICGSSFAGATYKEGVLTNVQFFGMMPMTNKDNEADFTANGSKLSYRIAASVRCVKD